MISSYGFWTISLSWRPCKVSQRSLTKNLPQQRFTSTRNVWLLWKRNNSQHVSYLWKQNLEVFKQFELRRQGTNVRPRWRPTRVWNCGTPRRLSGEGLRGRWNSVWDCRSDSSPHSEDCRTISRGFSHSTQDICFWSFRDLTVDINSIARWTFPSKFVPIPTSTPLFPIYCNIYSRQSSTNKDKQTLIRTRKVVLQLSIEVPNL